ncbi:TerC family protein [Candidatus Megaera venefica]|uniref:TerC family protein n=1 Tax=Candidatus Megaera venefica TaxID=2055910 RepID=A0ABU5NE17_9RICK|nr:TerC/Alx family metal homeostasis membrane protein [Candidatus Megaera venefica]MEA0971407.1 TerC family protein [Candidatus Megaera venefica]
METNSLYWAVFGTIVITLLILDLGVLNKRDHVMTLGQSLSLSLFYITIACCFGMYIHYAIGASPAHDYFTGFLLEKAMSLDNIFVISIIFSFFKIPLKYQHRVLFWGILGVIILRAIMISAGAILLAKFSWLLFIFGAILIVTGIKTLYLANNHSFDINDMYVYKLLKKKINIYPELVGNKFIVVENSKVFATPLLMALITIEFMDLVFAIDSIPAIFAITQNTFIVYTSNIFAILGLRALFFCLADIVERFKYIKYSLALILILIGVKIFAGHFIDIPKYIPLVVTFVLLVLGVLVSLVMKNRESKLG